MKTLPNTIDFMESLGFEFTLDWDGQLEVTYPDELVVETIAYEVGKYSDAVKNRLLFRQHHSMRRLIGGPFAGQKYTNPFCRTLYWRHVSRGKWAVYSVWADGRATFKGYATSEFKARRGQCVTATGGNEQ